MSILEYKVGFQYNSHRGALVIFVTLESCRPFLDQGLDIFVHPDSYGVEMYIADIRDDIVILVSFNRIDKRGFPHIREVSPEAIITVGRKD